MAAPLPLRRSQHLPDDLLAAAAREPLLAGLRLQSVGAFADDPEHAVDRRTWGDEYVLICCLSGRGRLTIGGQESAVGPGEVLCCPPHTAHAYAADPSDPWNIVWAHCLGREVDELFLRLGFEARRPVAVGDLGEVAELLRQALRALAAASDLAQLIFASGCLRQALLVIWERSRRPRAPAADAVEGVLALLRAEPALSWTVAELAARAGLSRAQFSRRVNERTGRGPIDYLIQVRMQRAAEALVTAQAPIKDVAAAVGYEDPYYFSRLFRRIMGQAPRVYRRRYGR